MFLPLSPASGGVVVGLAGATRVRHGDRPARHRRRRDHPATSIVEPFHPAVRWHHFSRLNVERREILVVGGLGLVGPLVPFCGPKWGSYIFYFFYMYILTCRRFFSTREVLYCFLFGYQGYQYIAKEEEEGREAEAGEVPLSDFESAAAESIRSSSTGIHGGAVSRLTNSVASGRRTP